MRRLLPILLSLSCATAAPPAPAPLPAHLADPDHHAPPECTAQTHLSAVGLSSEGREAAGARAKRNLLTKLGNTIHIEAESFAKLVSVDGHQSAEYHDVQRVLEKVDFAHADLIQLVGSPVERGSETYVVACLPRTETVARLQADMNAALARFDVWEKAAWQAHGRTDRPAFVSALNNCSAAMSTLAPTLVQLRVLAGEPAPIEQKLAQRWLALVAASTSQRARIRFVLDLEPDPTLQAVAADVSEVFRAALAPLASEVRLGSGCADAATHLVRVRARAECGRGSLGTTCRPHFEVDGQDCASGRQVFRTGLEKLKINAADPHGEEQALHAMLRRLDAQAIRAELKAALKDELPGEESR